MDVDDDQADVKEPAAHVGEVQSTQSETSVDKVPVSTGHSCMSALSPEGPEAFATAGQWPFGTWSSVEVLFAVVVNFGEKGLRCLVELFMEVGM